MALDPKKRQKKLAKRKAQRKDKAKTLQVKQQQHLAYQANRIALAARYPIHQCIASVSIFAGGLGTVIFSRRAGNGDIVAGVFLLDTFCLGVKSAFAKVLPPYEYDEMVSLAQQNELLQAVAPAYARKLIEEAVAYAETLGFKPDPDYHTTKDIFGDVNVSECTDVFTFGKDGKPFYVSGPLDTPLRRQQILATLEKNCGAGNYHFMTAIGGDSLFGNDAALLDDGFDFDDDDDDDDEEDDEVDDEVDDN